MIISDLPVEIQEVVFLRQEEQGNNKDKNISLDNDRTQGNFNWDESTEGYDFWANINCKDYLEFYKKYPKEYPKEYKCLPFPKDKSLYCKARVVKDIIKSNSDIMCKGSLPDIIPAGSITWFDINYKEIILKDKISTVCPEDNRYRANIPAEYFEIIEEENKINMKAIQEECKKRFPIGCKYESTDSNPEILKNDDVVYKIIDEDEKKQIYAHHSGGLLYENGKYATLISLPENKYELKENQYYYMNYDGDWYITKIKSIDEYIELFKNANEEKLEEINKNYMDADQSGIVVAMADGTDVSSYRSAMIPDLSGFYRPEDIYKNVIYKDNVRGMYFLEKGNTDTYKKMVEEQYK